MRVVIDNRGVVEEDKGEGVHASPLHVDQVVFGDVQLVANVGAAKRLCSNTKLTLFTEGGKLFLYSDDKVVELVPAKPESDAPTPPSTPAPHQEKPAKTEQAPQDVAPPAPAKKAASRAKKSTSDKS